MANGRRATHAFHRCPSTQPIAWHSPTLSPPALDAGRSHPFRRLERPPDRRLDVRNAPRGVPASEAARPALPRARSAARPRGGGAPASSAGGCPNRSTTTRRSRRRRAASGRGGDPCPRSQFPPPSLSAKTNSTAANLWSWRHVRQRKTDCEERRLQLRSSIPERGAQGAAAWGPLGPPPPPIRKLPTIDPCRLKMSWVLTVLTCWDFVGLWRPRLWSSPGTQHATALISHGAPAMARGSESR